MSGTEATERAAGIQMREDMKPGRDGGEGAAFLRAAPVQNRGSGDARSATGMSPEPSLGRPNRGTPGPYPDDTAPATMTLDLPPGTRPRVVVVGAGHGGLECVLALKAAAVDVLLVDRNNYHKFPPRL